MKIFFVQLLAIFSALSFLVSSASADVNYVVTDLDTLGGNYSYAYGINDKGQVVGKSNAIYQGKCYAFVYSNGTMTNLGTMDGFSSSTALGINNSGQIVGSVSTHSTSQAFLYEQGTMINIGQLTDDNTNQANAINDKGQVVIGDSCAYLYYNGSISELPSPKGYPINESANDINNNGTIVAEAFDFKGDLRFYYTSYIYNNGSTTSFDNPLGYSANRYSTFSAINNKGQAVGYANDNKGYAHAFVYSNGMITELEKFAGSESVANDINDKGQIVGRVKYGSGRAFLCDSSGSMKNLNDLIDSSSGWTLETATAINNLGQIVGYGENFAGKTHAYLLTPIGNCQSYQATPDTTVPIDRLAKWDGSNWVSVTANDPSLAGKNIHVLINGWAPGLKDFADNGGQSWTNIDPKTGEVVDNDYATIFTSLAKSVKNLAPDNVVLAYSWFDGAATDNGLKHAKESRNGTDEAGGDLLKALRDSCNFSANPDSKLQLFGISHGARVAAWTANELLRKDSIVVDQLTFCDSPEWGSDRAGGQNNIEQILPNLKLGRDAESTFVDSYISSFLAESYAGSGVVNVRLQSGSINPGVAHMYAGHWYDEASLSYNICVNDNALAWSPLVGDAYKTLLSNYEQDKSNPVNPYSLEPTLDPNYFRFLGKRDLSLTTLLTNGVVTEFQGGGNLEEHSPAFWHTSFAKGENDIALEFSYQFLNAGDGDQLGLWIDDELRFVMTGNIAGTNVFTSDIDITDLNSGYHILSIALHSYGEANASVNVFDFTMISEVPEPSTLVLLTVGLIALFAATKLRK